MNRTTKMLILALTLTPSLSFADALLQARSDVPATVILDGKAIGTTPLDIAKVRRGDHEIRFQALGTGVEQAFHVSVPRHVNGPTAIAAAFGPQVVRQAPVTVETVVQNPVVAPPVVVQPAYYSPGPAVVVTPIVVGRPYYHHYHYHW